MLILVVVGGCCLLSVALLWEYWFGCLDVLVFLVCVAACVVLVLYDLFGGFLRCLGACLLRCLLGVVCG